MRRISTPEELSKEVRAQRRRLRLSQGELASLVGVRRAWINKVEKRGLAGLARILELFASLRLQLLVVDDAVVDVLSGSGEPRGREQIGHRRNRPRERIPLTDGRADLQHPVYTVADLTPFSPDPSRFHESSYQPRLREMASAVVEHEAPIFEDVLASRLARAHGFSVTGAQIRKRIQAIIDPDLLRSKERQKNVRTGKERERVIIWPKGQQSESLVTFRASKPGVRSHEDVPLPELAGLARELQQSGYSEENIPVMMRKTFGMSRLMDGARERFGAAVTIGRKC